MRPPRHWLRIIDNERKVSRDKTMAKPNTYTQRRMQAKKNIIAWLIKF